MTTVVDATHAPGIVAALARHGEAPAVITPSGTTTYSELAARVDAVARQLGRHRRLALVEARRDLPWLVGYLGALEAGCPVLLLSPANAGTRSQIVSTYDPDLVLTGAGDEVAVREVRAVSEHVLHPDLALLLSTSGSSGSPKLVRLSRRNLLANASAVAASLGVRPDDRAVTTLPVEYCYGLSVVHSHLLRGAALVLTELSATEEAFWRLVRDARATSLAGVPYTFDLLDRVGFADMDLPDLRYVTQAGGRLEPSRVRAYAELGQARGWDLVVMYGQTEATARMAVLPPDLAAARPTSIGRPVPGGRFTLEPVEGTTDPEVGELVYEGPNVMLGYASTPEDLARGATVDRLRTGDLARRCPDGLYEVLGRQSRTAKLFGLRLDLAHLEELLQAQGITASCEPTDSGQLGVVVATVDDAPDTERVREVASSLSGLPPHAVRTTGVAALPRTPSGKLDAAAVRALLDAVPQQPSARSVDVRDLFTSVLGRRPAAHETFVDLGGDSLSYVEIAVSLEDLLPSVPRQWHQIPVGELAAFGHGLSLPQSRQRRPRRTLDTTVALRAVAIVLIVGSHSKLFDVLGGAHLLLAVAGYNLARFQLSADRRTRSLAVARSVLRIAVPAGAWVGAVALLTDHYGWQNVVLLNHVLGPREWGPLWSLWFIEALVVLMVGTAALLAVPAVDRAYRARPFLLASVLCAAGLLVRFDVIALPVGPGQRFLAHGVLWLFALGMAAAAATRRRQRLLVALAAAVGLHGWFGDTSRELVVLTGVVVLLTVERIPSTATMTRVAAALASASLYIYVTHWQVYPLWDDDVPALAFAASLALGLAYWQLLGRTAAAWRSGGSIRHVLGQRPALNDARWPMRREPLPPGCR